MIWHGKQASKNHQSAVILSPSLTPNHLPCLSLCHPDIRTMLVFSVIPSCDASIFRFIII